MAIRVLLAGDSEIVRNGLRSLLDSQEDIIVVGDVSNDQEFGEKVRLLQPDISILVLNIAPLQAIQAIHDMKKLYLKTQVIVTSLFSEPEYIHHFLQSGAAGFLLAESLGSEVVEAVRRVNKGYYFVSRKVARSFPMGEDTRLDTGSDRQEDQTQINGESWLGSSIGFHGSL